MDPTFVVYNSNNEAKSLLVPHRLTLTDCKCIDGEDDSCILYCVGYELEFLCEELGLDKDLPVRLTGPSNLALEIVHNHGIFDVGPMVLIPVHNTSPYYRGLHN